jgi:hypothetical protein
MNAIGRPTLALSYFDVTSVKSDCFMTFLNYILNIFKMKALTAKEKFMMKWRQDTYYVVFYQRRSS